MRPFTVAAEISCKGSGSGAAFDHPEAGKREEGRGKRTSPAATITDSMLERRIRGSTLPSSLFPLPQLTLAPRSRAVPVLPGGRQDILRRDSTSPAGRYP